MANALSLMDYVHDIVELAVLEAAAVGVSVDTGDFDDLFQDAVNAICDRDEYGVLPAVEALNKLREETEALLERVSDASGALSKKRVDEVVNALLQIEEELARS